ncbi:pancreatic lipase-related protein 2-like [Lampetra fluviatilis]
MLSCGFLCAEMWAAVLLGGLCVATVVTASQVCYDLGCFTDDVPYSDSTERPIKQLPDSPEKINTLFLLFTKANPDTWQELKSRDPSTIGASNFGSGKKTAFVVHGFIDHGEQDWVQDTCKAIVGVDDVNCVAVDWKGGSRTLYTKAANNIRVVGAEIAKLVNTMEVQYGTRQEDVHIIGHCLGAHAAAEAGQRLPRLGRITGLDPAESYFQNCDPAIRLDPSDAIFVDAIHTDAAPMIPNMGMGMKQPVGHLDFYPNGGEEMPGCDKNIISTIIDINGIWEGARDIVACNHLRADKYFTESLTNEDGFVGFPCGDYDTFDKGQCSTCPSGGCPRMGYFASNSSVAAGTINNIYYLNTGAEPSFSRWRYEATLTLSGTKSVRGIFKIALYGPNGNTHQHQLTPSATSLEPGKTYRYPLDSEAMVGEVTNVKFLWDDNIIDLFRPKLGVTRLELKSPFDRQTYNFCASSNEMVYEEVLLTINPC